MPDFHEQIRLISGLRDKCRKCDDSVYRARVNLHRINLRLQRAQQKQTIVDSDRDERIAALRRRIAELNARLADLRKDEQALADWFAQLGEQKRLLDHLQQNLEACRRRIEDVQRQIDELRGEEPPPADKIKALEEELDKLIRAQSDIEASIENVADRLHRLEREEERKRRQQEELKARIDALREELRGEQGRLTELLQPSFQDPATLDEQKNEIEATIDRQQAECGDCDIELQSAIADLYREDPHPRVNLARLDDRTPFLLLPVRLETIFVPIQSGEQSRTELWVRVYPDDIAIHTHEKTLTDREVIAGELYWTELIAAEYLNTEKDVRRRAAWRHLVELFGGQRGAWIARQTKPTDYGALAAAGATQTLIKLLESVDPQFFNDLLASDLSPSARTALQEAIAANDADAFSRLADQEKWFGAINDTLRSLITGFPVHDLTKTDAWTRAPRTKVLPDRFVLILYGRDDAEPREVTGNVIPDSLFVGPDPLNAKTAFEEKDNAKVYGATFNWMSDFDKAVDQGMGFRVNLSPAEARSGFAKILVLGVFLSANATESADLLKELIDNHQFGPKGFSLVAQGTPTNNTERNGTGYSDNDAYDDLAFFTATDKPAFDPADPNPKKSLTDGRLLADALGIDYSTVQTLQRANQTDVLEAAAMNRSLFAGTLGYWLQNWMGPVISPEIARQTRSFFTSFVSGRGPLPAVRIGDQPYGILLTSDFSRWKYPRHDDGRLRIGLFQNQITFLRNLHSLLSRLEQVWTDLADDLPFVGKANTDSMKVLIDILGLHPTSVEFFQRIGYSHEYLETLLSFKGEARHAGELNSMKLGLPTIARSYLATLGITRDDKTIRQMKSMYVLWQHYVTNLDVPNLVENKPPSETNQLSINYVDWLAKTDDVAKIISQDMGVAPPSALLYLMLRNALLLQLHHGAYEWLKERTAFEANLDKATMVTTLVGMRESLPSVSKLEIMGASVGVAEPAHPTPTVSVADWIWHGPDPTEIEASFLREQRKALAVLADTSTAQLERCLVEHIDCCNYRLDAWQTGLFTQRLLAQRNSGGQGQNRHLGIHLGAYGWVENVTQSAKVFLSADSLPPKLRPSDSSPILEEDDVIVSSDRRISGSKQGGFVHAPSLNHAAAAALLRNAYLSHADPVKAEMFSVNLSSERVRRAQFILEGMHNGQPIEALLGYQFERNLHDRTSESADSGDSPVLEFNQFILPYRQAFPFQSLEIVQAGTGGPTETIPPYSVVNGLKLIEAKLTAANGFGLGSILPPASQPTSTLGAAIVAEQNALLDTLDAVKDLLMAENAFQLVRGNFDRVAAVSLAQKEAHIPPDLEVIETPRGSEFTFTNRVTLHFEDLDPALASSNPWPGITMTPRAKAEPGMNHWLGSIFGPTPANIRCEVSWVETAADGSENLVDTHPVSLADLEIQPIDFVWLFSTDPENPGGATELETRIAFHYRRTHGISDDKITRIVFSPATAVENPKFPEVFPVAQQLRSLLLESRALNAEDFLPASGGKETLLPIDKNNPKGYDVVELRGRVERALNDLVALANSVDGPTAPTVQLLFLKDPNTPADDEPFTGKLGGAFDKLEEARLSFTNVKEVTVAFSVADAEILHQKLRSIANYGVGDAFPPESDLTLDSAKVALLARAYRTARRLRRKDPKDGVIDRATETLGKATTDKSIEAQVQLLLEAGKILFGESFNYLPKFSCHNEIDLATADGDRAQLLDHAADPAIGLTTTEVVEEWLQGLSRVRRAINRWETVRMLADALNDVRLEVLPVQVPYRAKDSWLAVEFPEFDPNPPSDPSEPPKKFGISRDTLSIVAHGKTAFQAGTKQSGVLIDDWTEEIPTDQETTGIAFRYNQPNATPPQALLLVVTPDETGSWAWDDIVGTLNDTLRRAKRRAVEPAQLEQTGTGWNTFAPALVSEFSTLQQSDVSLDLMRISDFVPLNEFYSAKAQKP